MASGDYQSVLPTDELSSASMDLAGNSTLAPIHYPREATIFAAVCSILFIVVGVAGNLTTIVALSRSVKLRVHATTAFVISLCVSDLLFCTINLPLTASRYIHEAWVLGDTLCSVFPFFFYGNVAVSLLNLVAITLNRYILIAHHSIYDRVYRRVNLYIMILAMWLFAFGIMVPPLLGVWGSLGLDPQSFSCTILKKDGKSPKKFLFLMGFLLPCVMIIVCNMAIFFKVCQSRRNLATLRSTSSSAAPGSVSPLKKPSSFPTVRKEDIRLAVMIAIIFLCFILSFLPLMIVNVFDDDVVYPSIHVVASVLAWASAVVNPFVYAVTNRQYRSAYRKLFCGSRTRRDASHRPHDHDKSNSSKTYITEFQYHASTAQVTSTPLQQRQAANNKPLI
ncbi:protein trapped in endoderm-1-like isoform X2 [Hyalella azteca]|uniref:Protein trapped in endoderm-1-like isoform X2 n=1 Tax=Hyalella azteca TaxID=294128 RepID=A0A8B7P592_HYAAZ|nr:protein trapped in endoderm-1-like isoform X2 [Hyalella azteca]